MTTRAMYYKSEEYKRTVSKSVYNDPTLKHFIRCIINSLTDLGIDNPSVIVMGRKYYKAKKNTINNGGLIIDNQPTIDDAKGPNIPLSNDVYQTIYDLLCELHETICQNGHVKIDTQIEVKLLGQRFTIGRCGLNIESLFGEKTVEFYGDIYPYNM